MARLAGPETPRPAGWGEFLVQLRQDLRFFAFAVALLTAGRVALLVAFRSHMGAAAGTGAVADVLLNGLRFDGQVALLFVFGPFLLSVASGFGAASRAAERARTVALALFTLLTVLLEGITLGYFQEYHDQFNAALMGVVYDDRRAVLTTIAKEYPLPLIVAGVLVLSAAITLLALRWVRRPAASPPPHRLAGLPTGGRLALVVALVLATGVVARGSLGTRPAQEKDVAVTADAFLNATVLNPYKALYYAIQGHRRLADPQGYRVFLPDGDLAAAARRVFGPRAASRDLDAMMAHTAPGAATPPRHVFLVVGESYSEWPLLPRFRALGIASQVERLAATGLLFRRFLPAGTGTMASLGPLLTGLEDPGVPISYQPLAEKPFPTSMAVLFRRLGYRTRFFYAGYLSWERVGTFAASQGFDEVYGGGDAGSWSEGNEWGVSDERLFDFVLSTVKDDVPSFNVILTASNHPPFDLDVWAKGFPLRAMPPELAPLWSGDYTLKQIGHFWYADHCLGRFTDEAERALPGVLVAITGDHDGRRHLESRPPLNERSFVPLLLHGPGVLPHVTLPPGAVGSHTDLTATLVDLAAPAGFTYPALGHDLLAPGGASTVTFGAGLAVSPDYLVDLSPPPGEPSSVRVRDAGAAPDVAALKRRSDDLRALSWWRVVRGPRLSGAPPE